MLLIGKPNLESLAEIPWCELEHAYGPAENVPERIHLLATGDEDDRVNVIDSFYGDIFHQGTRYSATIATIPFLIDLLRYEGVQDRHRILQILPMLALGYPEQEVVDGVDLEGMAKWLDPLVEHVPCDDDEDNEDDDDDCCGETSLMDVSWSCYSAAAAGCPTYAALLSHPDKRIQINAAFALAWFPAHARFAIPRLMDIARETDIHPFVRASALLSASHLVDPNDVGPWVRLLEELTVQSNASRPGGGKIRYVAATACFCLLRHYLVTNTADIPEQTKRLAEACLKHDIASTRFNPYRRNDYDEFPWGDLKSHLQRLVCRLLARPSNNCDPERKLQAARLADCSFSIDGIIAELYEAQDAESAMTLGKLLLDHAFGEKFSIHEAENSDRAFPSADWTDEQREVLQAIADCDACWPEISFLVHEATEIDFDPEQDELQDALERPFDNDKSEGMSVDPPQLDGAPTERQVVDAVRQLLAVFEGTEKEIEEELARFEPFRPYCAAAVPMLVELIREGDCDQRQSAAWAIGRIGPPARSAVPTLLEAFQDVGNDYAYTVLGDVGMDDVRPLVALMSHDDEDVAWRARWAFGQIDDVPDDVLDEMRADSNEDIRYTAIARLRGQTSAGAVVKFISALEDENEEVRVQARFGLKEAGPVASPVVLDAFPNADVEGRRLLADVLVDFASSLAPHVTRLTEFIRNEEDTKTAEQLVCCLANVTPASPEIIGTLMELSGSEHEAPIRVQAIRGLSGVESAETLSIVSRAALEDASARVRALAVESLRRFRGPEELLLSTLNAALADEDESVRLKAVWTLFVKGRGGVPILADHLEFASDERLHIEISWALGLMKAAAKQVIPQIEQRMQADSILLKSVCNWALSRIASTGDNADT